MNTKEIFAKNLKSFREAKKLTQAQLAELVRIDTSFVSKMESAKHFPDPEKIDLLAKVLGISPVSLFSSKGYINEERATSALQPYIKKIEDTYDLLIEDKDKRIADLANDKNNLNEQLKSLYSILGDLTIGLRSFNKAN